MGLGDELRDMVYKRLGINNSRQLKCPREKSDMTPCVARDGDLAATENGACVGCGASIYALWSEERHKMEKGGKNARPKTG